LLQHSFSKGQDYAVRESLTNALAYAGRFMRREHPPVPPPTPIWISLSDEQKSILDNFSSAWQHIFKILETWEQIKGNYSGMAWLKLGGSVNRSIREFSLWFKADALFEQVQEFLNNNEKVVVVLETTLEAALVGFLDGVSDEECDEESVTIKTKRKGDVYAGAPLLWRNRLIQILEKLIPSEEVSCLPKSVKEDFWNKYQKVLSVINGLPDWHISPLDYMKDKLKKIGIQSGELSGRKYETFFDGPIYKIKTRANIKRNQIVSDFNSGKTDVIFVTRAGCAGISLHAGISFADQRKRNLVEWDLAVNASNRVQFWGRVRRRDQVLEPSSWGLVLDTAFDRRIQEKEEKKRLSLSAHSGSALQIKNKKILPWISEIGEYLVAEWSRERPTAARRIGVGSSLVGEPTGRIERALLRAIVLPKEEQDGLLTRLSRGLEISSQMFYLSKMDCSENLSWVVRSENFLGSSVVHEMMPNDLNKTTLKVVERSWASSNIPSFDEIKSQLMLSKNKDKFLNKGIAAINFWECHVASEENNGTVHSDFFKEEFDWFKKSFKDVVCGSKMFLTHPGTGEIKLGMFLEFDWPSTEIKSKFSATNWCLSQIGILFWAVGELEPWLVPLFYCKQDEHFKIYKETLNGSYFKMPSSSVSGVTLEGNNVLAAYWGQQAGIGRQALINDFDGGMRWVWMLPKSLSFDDVKNLPRVLLKPELVFMWLNKFPNDILFGSIVESGLFTLQNTPDGLLLCMAKDLYDNAINTWLHFKLDRLLTQPKTSNGVVKRFIPKSGLKMFVYSLDAQGVQWKVKLNAQNKDYFEKINQNF